MNRSSFALAALFGMAAGCGAGQRSAFSHQFADNRSEDFAAVLERLPEPRPNTSPRNATGEPIAVVTTHGEGADRAIAAIAIPSGEERWRRPLEAQTRPEILGDIVLSSERHQLVALDLRTGQPRWTVRLPDLAYVGATRDGDTIYFSSTVGALGGARRVGHVTALDASDGSERWRHEVEGVFGQPAAAGGMVMVPWERQNLAVLDEATGIELARLRSTDDVLAWAFQDPTGVYYGHRSIYRLTHRSVRGTRSESTHREVPIPELPVLRDDEVEREVELWDDGFLPKPGTRTARGRIRLYFAPAPSAGPEQIEILGDRVYFVFYRYVFGYDLDGQLRWARILEQDVIGAQPTAEGLFVVGEQGSMRVLDRDNGLDRWSGGNAAQLASVALDVAGFTSPEPAGPAPSLREALNAIAVDPDNRLVTARAYAIARLAELEEAEITRDLLDLYSQQSMPGALRNAIAFSLRARRSGPEHLIAALGRRYDFLEATAAPPLEVIVPSLLEMRAAQAVPGLVQQLNDHETPAAVLPIVVRAIVELGDASVVPALRHFLVLYHADSTFGENAEALTAAANGIFRLGGEEGRQLLTSLAAEGRTVGPLREAITGFFAAEEAEAAAIARRQAEEAEAALQAAARQAEAELPTRLTQEQVNATFAGHADPLRTCVAAEIARNPLLGQVRLVFILNNDGRAAEIGVAPNTPELVQCMQQSVAAIEFPRFRQRRMRAQFVIHVRGGASGAPADDIESGAQDAGALPPDAPWWAFWQRRGAPGGTVTQRLAWWERRPAPARAQVAAPTQTGSGSGTGSGTGTVTGTSSGRPWWMGAGEDGEEESAEQGGAEVAPAPPPPEAQPREPQPRGRGRRGGRGAAQPPGGQPPAAQAPAAPPAAQPPAAPPAAQAPAAPPAAQPPARQPPAQPQPPAQEETPWWAPAEGG